MRFVHVFYPNCACGTLPLRLSSGANQTLEFYMMEIFELQDLDAWRKLK